MPSEQNGNETMFTRIIRPLLDKKFIVIYTVKLVYKFVNTTLGTNKMWSSYTGGLTLYAGSPTRKVYPCTPVKCGLK